MFPFSVLDQIHHLGHSDDIVDPRDHESRGRDDGGVASRRRAGSRLHCYDCYTAEEGK